jgi:hypothetical protein
MPILSVRISVILALLMLSSATASAQINLNPVPITPRTDNLFTISGFVPRYARTPEQLRHLRALQPDTLITRTRNGKTTYLYADPTECVCVYVGTPQAYQVYQNGGPVGYVGDEANKSSPRFSVRPLWGEMADDPYVNDPGAPSLDNYLFNEP